MPFKIYQRDAVGGYQGMYGKRGISWTAWRLVSTETSPEESQKRLDMLKQRNGMSEFKTKETKR